MSMMTTAYLLERYGPRLTVEELAEVLRLGVPTMGLKAVSARLAAMLAQPMH